MIDPSQLEAFQNDLVFGHLENRTLIEVRGADRITFLHNLCTNDIKALATGHGCEAFFTNVQGKTLCHALLFAADASIWISTDAGLSGSLVQHLDKYLIREDVQVLDRSAGMATHVLAGPRASEFVQAEFGNPIEQMLEHAGLPGMSEAWVAKVPFAEPAAFFIVSPQGKISEVASQLSASQAMPVRDELLELARIQARFPSSGRDVTTDNLPQEIGRDELAISFTKGCYLGQETVARIDALGRVNKYLVRFQFDGRDTPPPKTSILHDDKIVGHVTSSCWSPSLKGAIALGYLRREVQEQGGELVSDFGTVKVIV